MAKKLFFVPIIHSWVEMGSIETIVAQKGISMIGEQAWEKYKKSFFLKSKNEKTRELGAYLTVRISNLGEMQ